MEKLFDYFNVRIVRKNDRYGLNDCIVHDDNRPLVEFYDYRYRDNFDWKRGQFVSRYFAFSILERDPNKGLDLYGGTPAWCVNADLMEEIRNWVKEEITADAN